MWMTVRELSRYVCVVAVCSLTMGACVTPSIALAARHWSGARCTRAYRVWLRTHHGASKAQKNYELRLDASRGCHLVRPKPPALVPLTGVGTPEPTWRSEHQVDPNLPNGALSNQCPASSLGRPFKAINVVFTNGKVESISENFPPGISQALARATIAVLIPADAQLAFSAINIGKCAVEQLVSRSLGVEGANGGSFLS